MAKGDEKRSDLINYDSSVGLESLGSQGELPCGGLEVGLHTAAGGHTRMTGGPGRP